MNDPFIIIKNVSKVFMTKGILIKSREYQALHDINLEIYENETLGLVGESGCGKTTLGRIMTGLEKPSEGQVFFRGENIFEKVKMDSSVRKKVQMIFQDPYASLDPKMKIEDILLEPLLANRLYKTKAEGIEKVKELLQIVGLDEECMRRYPQQFSGGQRQRIGIARALALSPEFIVCDEPVSALDVSVQAQILNLLKTIQSERRLSMLFISHDLGVVRYIADRVAVLHSGHLCEVGPVEEVYSHPKHPYTKYLIDSVPKMQLRNDLGNKDIKIR